MNKTTKIITGIDLGTSEIKVVIGEIHLFTDNIKILGYSSKKSKGIIKGEITDINKATDILNKAIYEAEDMSGTVIDPNKIYVSITGKHISSEDASATIAIDSSNHKIKESHLNNALNSAKSIIPASDNEILDTIDGEYILDKTYQVENPLGQIASELEAHSHIIYANQNRMESFLQAVENVGFEESTPVFSGIASAMGVFTPEDFEKGSLMLNMGAGTTEYILFQNYSAKESGVMPIGINHIINDLYLGLDLTFSTAKQIFNNIINNKENLNKNFIWAEQQYISKQVPVVSIEKVIELRLNETFELIYENLKNKDLLYCLNNGIVLSGGITNYPKITTILNHIFDTQVREGNITNINASEEVLNNTAFITSIGLIFYGEHEHKIKCNVEDSNTLLNKLYCKALSVWGKTLKLLFKNE